MAASVKRTRELAYDQVWRDTERDDFWVLVDTGSVGGPLFIFLSPLCSICGVHDGAKRRKMTEPSFRKRFRYVRERV